MLIKVRDSDGRRRAKDILDIDFDMYVRKVDGENRYQVVINHQYTLNDTFETEEEAEDAMDHLVDSLNDLEEELRREG